MKMEEYSVEKRKMNDSECSQQEQTPPARPQGALALVGAWREVTEEELESLIEDIYAGRSRDMGRRVELEV